MRTTPATVVAVALAVSLAFIYLSPSPSNSLQSISLRETGTVSRIRPIFPKYSAFGSGRTTRCNAETEMIVPKKYKSVTARGDRLLVAVPEADETSSGGILLPSSMQSKPGYGKVIALGDGFMPEGQKHKFQLKVGDSLLFTTYAVGRVKIAMEENKDESLVMMREGDVIGIMPKESPDYSDVPELKPLFNSVLLRMAEQTADSGGIFLIGGSRQLPKCGHVVRIAPGRLVDDEFKPPENVKENDFVMIRGGGTEIETGADLWNVVDASYVVGKMPFASEREIYDLEPFEDWMVMKLEEPPETTKGGLFLNTRLAGQVTLAVVQKSGPGVKDPNTGNLIPNEFEVGDRVMFRPDNIQIFDGPNQGEKYILVRQRDVVCKISGEVSDAESKTESNDE
ncbi:hypothetical protein AAMO2058_000424000 [Amorphochlora amoebiformis]